MKKIIAPIFLALLFGSAFAQSSVQAMLNSRNNSESGAINSGVNTYVNSYGSPVTSGFLDSKLDTNQAQSAASSFSSPAVLGTCQTAGAGGSLQLVGGGVNFAAPGQTEVICKGINKGTLHAREAEATGVLKAQLKASNCNIEEVADDYETANAIDPKVAVCPRRLKRADREAREDARATAALKDRPFVAAARPVPVVAAGPQTTMMP